MTESDLCVVVVGGGPRATSFLERLIMRLPETAPESLRVVVVDPHAPGPRAVWTLEQPAQYLNNTSAGAVTAFAGPADEIPYDPESQTLLTWAAEIAHRGGRWHEDGDFHLADPSLVPEAAGLRADAKPSRRLQGEYYRWVYQRARHRLPGFVTVEHRATRAIDVVGDGDRAERVELADGTRLRADLVILAHGFTPDADDDRTLTLRRHARDRGLRYFGPALAAAHDFSTVGAGERVLVGSMGATFFDLLGELYEGRGGRYRRLSSGRLTYLPSGREPALLVGSRTGLPHRTQAAEEQLKDRTTVPFLANGAAQMLLERHAGRRTLTFDAVWRVVDEEVRAVYAERAAALGVAIDLDWDRLISPAAGRHWSSSEAWQGFLDDYLEAELLGVRSAAASPWLAAHQVMGAMRVFAFHAARRRAFDDDALAHVYGWLLPAANILASGPPAVRFEQLVALRWVGLVEIIGPQLNLEPSPDGFRAWTSAVADAEHAATIYVEARQRISSVSATADAIIRHWRDRGELRRPTLRTSAGEQTLEAVDVTTPGNHPIDRAGHARRSRVVLGCSAFHAQPDACMAAIPGFGGTFVRAVDEAAVAVAALLRREAPILQEAV